MNKYHKIHSVQLFPNITPHVFRHTFCSRYANAGMNIKNLQYLMGHSDAGVKLNVYAHANYENAVKQMRELGNQKGTADRITAKDEKIS